MKLRKIALVFIAVVLLVSMTGCNSVSFLSAGLMLTSVALVFMTNLRAKPQAFDLSQGEEEYLKTLNDYYKNNPSTSERPNVLVILMDDMGYGDTSLNGNTVFSTPTFDYIGEEGLNFENFSIFYQLLHTFLHKQKYNLSTWTKKTKFYLIIVE